MGLSDMFKITKLLATLQDKLDAAATGIKDMVSKHEALDKRVYSLEERGKFERELGDREKIQELSNRIIKLEAQIELLSQWAEPRSMVPPPMRVVNQPPQLPHD